MFKIEGYIKASSYCRTNHEKGGCLILVKQHLKFKVRNDISKMSEELVWELACVEFKDAIIVVVYRSPSADLNKYLFKLEQCLDKLTANNNKTVVICGDFNVDFLGYGSDCTSVTDLMDSFLLRQLVYQFTRVTKSMMSCLDNIFTDSSETKNVCVLPGVKSDHCAQTVDIRLFVEFIKPVNIKLRRINNFTIDQLKLTEGFVKPLTVF